MDSNNISVPENRRKRKRLSAAEAEELIVRLLDLMLAYGSFDEYWFQPVGQNNVNAQQILKDGRVHGGVLRDFAAILAGVGSRA